MKIPRPGKKNKHTQINFLKKYITLTISYELSCLISADAEFDNCQIVLYP